MPLDKSKESNHTYVSWLVDIDQDVIPHKSFPFYCGVKLPVHMSIL